MIWQSRNEQLSHVFKEKVGWTLEGNPLIYSNIDEFQEFIDNQLDIGILTCISTPVKNTISFLSAHQKSLVPLQLK